MLNISQAVLVEVLLSNPNCLNSASGAQLLLPGKVAGLLEDMRWISGFHCGFVGAQFFGPCACEEVQKD